MDLLKVSGISKKEQDFSLENISFTQAHGQKLAIAGAAGAGKTTLLKIIAGLGQADEGEVYFDGKKVKGLYEQMMPGHKSIGYLSQHFELRNKYRVHELLDVFTKLSPEEAQALFVICRIDHLLNRWTHELSGGEKQRVALLLLLVAKPKLLILDEPFSNLDLINKNILKKVIRDICEQMQMSCILTSHDPTDMLTWADEILVLKNGRMIQQAPPRTIYYKPIDEYVAELFGPYNLLNPDLSTVIAQQAGLPLKGKKLFARPEAIALNISSRGVRGIVQLVVFTGGAHQLEILALGQIIVTRTPETYWKAGDEVIMSLVSGVDADFHVLSQT